ncbi:MAG: hypothetical protein E7554_03115 [Ruminococcaceae bacterium]|nr:hypothetical protein [Oscillospiraceae bacterium]
MKGNFSKFGAYYRYKLRSMRTLTILNSIFALLSYPLVMTLMIFGTNLSVKMEAMYEIENYHKLPEYIDLKASAGMVQSLAEAAVVICFLMLAAMFLMNYVFISKAFRWLYKKSVVDMDYSLPVSDDTRFFGDLLASLTGSLVPHLGAIAVGGGLYWLLPFEGMKAPSDEVAALFGVLLQLVFTGVAACVMFMGICLLVMSCCGRVVESRIMPFVANAVIPIIHVICIINLTQGLYGYGYNSDYEYMSIGTTSPLGLLFATMLALVNAGYLEDFFVPMLRPEIMIPLIIITVGCFVGAYLLIRFRRAERVGSPYVYSGFKLVMPSVVIFSIVALFAVALLPSSGKIGELRASDVVGPIAAMVIITFIIYLIMELISGRGFAKFHRTIGRYALTVAVSVGVCLMLYFSQGMGFASLVPDVDDVDSAEIQMYVLGDDYDGCPEIQGVEMVSDEDISRLIEVHESLPKKDRNLRGEYNFNVEYRLYGGSIIHREYSVTREEYIAAMNRILTPEVFLRDQLGRYIGTLAYDNTDRLKDYRITYIRRVDDMKAEIEADLPMEDLVAALKKDAEMVSVDLLNSKEYENIRMGFDVVYKPVSGNDTPRDPYLMTYIDLWEWQENTIELLEQNGAEILLDY